MTALHCQWIHPNIYNNALCLYTAFQKFGISNTFSRQEAFNWPKVTRNTFIFQINAVQSNALFKESWITLSTTTVFNTDAHKKCFLWILEWFLKDHVTLMPGVMMLKAFISLAIKGIKDILQYIKIENYSFKLIHFRNIMVIIVFLIK